MSNVSEVLGQKAIEWMNGFEALTKQYAPKVVDAAMQVVQVNAISHLVTAGICLIVCGCIAFLPFRAAIREYRKERHDEEYVIVLVALAVIPIVFTMFALIEFADVWSWVAVFQPKLAIAHMIFGKVMQ